MVRALTRFGRYGSFEALTEMGSSRGASAGLLMYRLGSDGPELFLGHPGGPYYRNRDEGVWSVPKGRIEKGGEPLLEAIREFREETGIEPCGEYLDLGSIKQSGGKTVRVFAFEAPADLPRQPEVTSNSCEIEWPPGSGKKVLIPEIDRAQFFDPQTARRKILPAQSPLIERLLEIIATFPETKELKAR